MLTAGARYCSLARNPRASDCDLAPPADQAVPAVHIVGAAGEHAAADTTHRYGGHGGSSSRGSANSRRNTEWNRKSMFARSSQRPTGAASRKPPRGPAEAVTARQQIKGQNNQVTAWSSCAKPGPDQRVARAHCSPPKLACPSAPAAASCRPPRRSSRSRPSPARKGSMPWGRLQRLLPGNKSRNGQKKTPAAAPRAAARGRPPPGARARVAPRVRRSPRSGGATSAL
jgi:hypothetical protein